MYSSMGLSGDTVNGKHKQIHHYQLLMSMHLLHADDHPYSQAIMDDIMTDKKSPKQMTLREQQQRWWINQMYAMRVLVMFAFTTTTGVMCLIVWAMIFANKSHSGLQSRA